VTEWKVIEGDCVDVMRRATPASVDAIVCDPPYGIGFMGKEWDGAAIAAAAQRDRETRKSLGPASASRPGRAEPRSSSAFGNEAIIAGPVRGGHDFQAWCETWALEALRVLKPGGHLLAFGGTRTYHRLACAIEDAGFEIRDTIAWMYGSGFPKSLDVSKAIDRRRDDTAAIDTVRAWLNTQRIAAGVTLGQINETMGLASNGGGLASTWTTNCTTRAVPQWEQWEQLRALVGFGDEMDAEVWRLNGRKGQPGDAWSERPLLGRSDELLGRRSGIGNGASEHYTVGGTLAEAYDVTAPATPDAERWQGWGTALKPAHEPIVVARKPLNGTVAANVLAHGTGALNVDGCRIGTETIAARKGGLSGSVAYDSRPEYGGVFGGQEGRWPTNVVLDPETAAMLDAQTGELHSQDPRTRHTGQKRSAAAPEGWVGVTSFDTHKGDPVAYADSGGASRFFYVAKASSAERNAGLDGFEEREMGEFSGGMGGGASIPLKGSPPPRYRNVHPTVKPIALMRWLVRLVTPSGGLILDPLAGSGTTGCAAVLEGFRFVGIEREAEYAAIARARIAWWAEHPDGMELVARLEAEKQRKAVADAGQLDLFGGAA
jgi:DNA modification methylase